MSNVEEVNVTPVIQLGEHLIDLRNLATLRVEIFPARKDSAGER